RPARGDVGTREVVVVDGSDLQPSGGEPGADRGDLLAGGAEPGHDLSRGQVMAVQRAARGGDRGGVGSQPGPVAAGQVDPRLTAPPTAAGPLTRVDVTAHAGW